MFDPTKSEELKTLLEKLVGQSPFGYMEDYGNGALELLKTKPIPKNDDLVISSKDNLLNTILGDMEHIEINLSSKDDVNSMDFNLKNIADQELDEAKGEKPILSTWYKDFEEEFLYHKPNNIKILKGYENSISYWLICKIGNFTPFQIHIPRLYTINETHTYYDALFTMSKNEIQYIHQYYYVGNGKFLSFYQIFWDLVNKKLKIIIRKIERNTEILRLNVIDECLREAMKITCTYVSPDLCNWSLWLMNRQFKIEEVADEEGNINYRKISGDWYDKVTGSFGNVGSKHSLKHGVEIKLIDGEFKPIDKNIIDFPYATERMTNIFPGKAGFKRINVTCIEKSPLKFTDIDDDGNPYNRFQDKIPIHIKEVDYRDLPVSEEINLTCILIDIKDDIGSLRNNTLDMFNMNSNAMNKLMTADENKVTHGNKLILPFREKAIIGGAYGSEEITQVDCTIKIKDELAENVFNHFCEQDIECYSNGSINGMASITFVPDLIMNHTNRDNNVALRLLSNLRYESISENKIINISLKDSNETALRLNDEILVKVNISINGSLIESLETQLLFLTGYHQETHSAFNTARYGKLNTNYRQALAARQVFTPKDFDWIMKNYDKNTYKAKLICSGHEIVTTNEVKQHRLTEDELMLSALEDV